MSAPLLTIRECATRLNRGEQFVRRLVGSGRLPGSKIGNAWRVDADDLEAFIVGHRPQPAIEPIESDRDLPAEAASRYA